MNEPHIATTLDVRPIAGHLRHATIFASFDRLKDGTALELINDHDPLPLRAQFLSRHGRRFGWEYLEAGPRYWRVAITRLGAHADGVCCGSCGGA